jgi:hypothetical protein
MQTLARKVKTARASCSAGFRWPAEQFDPEEFDEDDDDNAGDWGF